MKTILQTNFAWDDKRSFQLFVSCLKKSRKRGVTILNDPEPEKKVVENETMQRRRLTFCKVQTDWDHALLKMQ